MLSYDVDVVDIFRRAASYVDRILHGAKPGDLPVQFPDKIRDGPEPMTWHAAANSVALVGNALPALGAHAKIVRTTR